MATAASKATLVVLVVLCASVYDVSATSLEAKEFYTNTKKLETFVCSVPQARLVYVVDQVDINHGVTYKPSATVLHRCDNSMGYCSAAHLSCGAVEEQLVSVTFFAIPHRWDRRTFFQQLQFVNHTRCGCIHSTEAP